MRLTVFPSSAYSERVENDLVLLEQKISSLIAHTHALRAANEELRRELAAAQDKNRELEERMNAAGARLDSVLARMPVG